MENSNEEFSKKLTEEILKAVESFDNKNFYNLKMDIGSVISIFISSHFSSLLSILNNIKKEYPKQKDKIESFTTPLIALVCSSAYVSGISEENNE